MSSGINLHAKKAARKFALLPWHILLAISAIDFRRSTPTFPKLLEISIWRHPSGSITEGPAAPLVFFIASFTIPEFMLS